MRVDDPAGLKVIRRAMVARLATLSRNGRPSITPIYFVYVHGHIWLGTSEWTLAAREVKADPRVSVLFNVERNPQDGRILRVTGQARVRTDPAVQRSYNLRVLFKYVLTPGGIRNYLAHLKQYPLMNQYHAQSAEKGLACVIDVTPEQAEFLNDSQPG